MQRTLSRDLPAAEPGTTVRLQGWVHRRRELAQLTFLVVRDRTGLAQVVVRGDAATGLPPEETPVEVVGTATANPQAPGGVEVTEPTVTALSDDADTPPVELWRPTLNAALPTLLDHAAVTWRHPMQRAKWELAAASLKGFRETLDASGFTEVASPKLVESATESGANVFEVDYFGRQGVPRPEPAVLQAGAGRGLRARLRGRAGVPRRAARHGAAPGGVREPGRRARLHRGPPRGDPGASATSWPAWSRPCTTYAAPAVERLAIDVPVVPEEIPLLHFREALEIAGAPADEPDLAPAHERALGDWAKAEHGSDFLVVEGYPTANRAFYSHPDPEDPHWSRSFDLIFRGTELVSGAQRLHRYDDYVRTLEERGYPYEPYASYVEAFRRGIPPHGGFAIGLERFVGRLTESANIREVTLFPRDLHRLAP